MEIALQVSGKVRARIEISVEYTKEQAIQAAKDQPKIAAELSGKQIVKEIYVPGKLVNIVAK